METCTGCGELAVCCYICFDCERCCNKIAGIHLASLKTGTPFEYEKSKYVSLLENDFEEVQCLNSQTKQVEELYLGIKVKPLKELVINGTL